MITSSSDADIMGNSQAMQGCFIVDFSGINLYYRYSKSSSTSVNLSIDNTKWYNFIFSDIVFMDKQDQLIIKEYDFSTNTQKFLIGKVRTYGSAKFKELKIYDDIELVRNYIPCYRKSDNVVGMYDLVEDKFHTNSGTGDFVAGPEV